MISNLKIIILFSIVSLIISSIIKFIFLKYIYPDLYYGVGLMNVGDWIFFHENAILLHKQIVENYSILGFKVLLDPFYISGGNTNQIVIGFLSIFYFLFSTNPIFLMPFFAIIHGLGAFFLFKILLIFKLSREISLIASSVFVFLPSGYLFFSQIHKDIIYAPFILGFIYGNLRLINFENFKSLIYGLIITSICFILLNIIRPHYFLIYFLSVTFQILIVTFYYTFKLFIIKRFIYIPAYVLVLSTFLCLLISNSEFRNLFNNFSNSNSNNNNLSTPYAYSNELKNQPSFKKDEEIDKKQEQVYIINKENIKENIKENYKESNKESIREICPNGQVSINNNLYNVAKNKNYNDFIDWINQLEENDYNEYNLTHNFIKQLNNISKTNITEFIKCGRNFKAYEFNIYIPNQLDKLAKRIYMMRTYFYSVEPIGTSTFDREIELNSFIKIVKYLPSAITYGLLSPFPQNWFKKTTVDSFYIFRIINSLETFFLYLLFPFFIYFVFTNIKNLNSLIILANIIIFTVIPAYVLPNVGTILRVRYSCIALILAISISFIINKYLKK